MQVLRRGYCLLILGNICTVRAASVMWLLDDRVCRLGRTEKVAQCETHEGGAVLTSVDRDDLADGGSIIWAETVKAIRRISPRQPWQHP